VSINQRAKALVHELSHMLMQDMREQDEHPAIKSGAAVGSIALADLEHGNGMLRYWLLPEGRGRGLATRAVRLMARWAFEELGLGRLALFIERENVASQAVAARCGFVLEGVMRQHMEGPDGQRVDSRRRDAWLSSDARVSSLCGARRRVGRERRAALLAKLSA
jgi:RimJ/RimL family protein N-acetyltransferase